jgi:hypothetical protein
MLHYPDEVLDKIEEITRRAKRKRQAPVETARQLLAVEPTFVPAILMEGLAVQDTGDPAQAEELLWKALSLGPDRGETYLYLGTLIQRRRPGDPVAERLQELAFWKFSMAEQVKGEIAALLGGLLKNVGPATDPYTYRMLATAYEKNFNQTHGVAAAEEDKRLAPYQVLNDLEREVEIELERETLRKVLDGGPEYTPLLHAALRERSNVNPKYRALNPPALGVFAAILGETGGPELIADLFELADDPDGPTFFHVHWAIHRLGQRFPETALEAFRDATRDSSAAMRCSLAEQLNLLPEIEGVVPALAALLDEFPMIAEDDEDAPYLLAIVTDAMAERGKVEEAHAILSRCEGFLTTEGRAWVAGAINGDEDFVPELVEEGIAGFDIEDVCLKRVLMGDEEEEKIDDGEFVDDEDEEFEDDELDDWLSDRKTVFTPRVGRNDPCWCGSGRKYKKCHLPADEEAHFAR